MNLEFKIYLILKIQGSSFKSYVDNTPNDPSILENTAQIDFNGKNLDNVRFVELISMPAIGKHLTANYIVDNASSDIVDQSSFLRLGPKEKLKLDEQDFVIPKPILTSPKTILELPTKSYVDSLHENCGNRRD